MIFETSALPFEIRCHPSGDPRSALVFPRILGQPFFYSLNSFYLTTSTGQWACETVPLDTLPSRIFLNPPSPLVPTRIKSTFSLTAWLIVVSTMHWKAQQYTSRSLFPIFSPTLSCGQVVRFSHWPSVHALEYLEFRRLRKNLGIGQWAEVLCPLARTWPIPVRS